MVPTWVLKVLLCEESLSPLSMSIPNKRVQVKMTKRELKNKFECFVSDLKVSTVKSLLRVQNLVASKDKNHW